MTGSDWLQARNYLQETTPGAEDTAWSQPRSDLTTLVAVMLLTFT